MSKKLLIGLDNFLEKFLRWGSIICLISLFILVTGCVLFRFLPILSMGWADEIIEFFFAWMIFLCAAALGRNRTHFRVELLAHKLAGKKSSKKLEITLYFLALFFFLVFSYEGWLVSTKATDRSPIMEWPRYLWYFVLPFSGVIMSIYTIRDLYQVVRNGNNKKGKTPKED